MVLLLYPKIYRCSNEYLVSHCCDCIHCFKSDAPFAANSIGDHYMMLCMCHGLVYQGTMAEQGKTIQGLSFRPGWVGK